jgi:hypothetical protein
MTENREQMEKKNDHRKNSACERSSDKHLYATSTSVCNKNQSLMVFVDA